MAVHIYTQTIYRTTQITTERHKLTTNVEECGPCPVFASFILAFALQLRKKHGKTSVRLWVKPQSGYMGVGGQRHYTATLGPGKTRYPLYRRLGGTQGRSGWVWKIPPLPIFDPRTVHPVAIRYTDWAIPTHVRPNYSYECLCNDRV